jgi:tetratricopeptide (TPR) repeat protein
MNISRLELLRKYVDEEPSDPFNWYSLALEEQKHNAATAAGIYQHLLKTFPEYIPTYYQAGLLYQQLGNHDLALEILKKGALECEKVQNLKTKREILSVIMEIEEE